MFFYSIWIILNWNYRCRGLHWILSHLLAEAVAAVLCQGVVPSMGNYPNRDVNTEKRCSALFLIFFSKV